MWDIFHRKPLPLQKVTTGRFEIEQDGEVAYLEYSLSGNILELIHTEVPEKLRHLGLSSALAEEGLKWAREHNLKSISSVRRYADTSSSTRSIPTLRCVEAGIPLLWAIG